MFQSNFTVQADPSSGTVDLTHERCLYDDAEFLNSVKNGKNAVLSAASQKAASVSISASGSTGSASSTSTTKTTHGKSSNSNHQMSSIDVSELALGTPALKDVMKLIAICNEF